MRYLNFVNYPLPMKMKALSGFLYMVGLTLCTFELSAQTNLVNQPVPNVNQLKWHELEFYLFMHFGPNTFTDKEWGHGDEPEDVFQPSQLDCRQWARIAKDCGAKGIIITGKHHDGFCLWPSKFSTHTVRESKWQNGEGDVLRDLSNACRESGLLFGVYISPWDRNHPMYGTPAYNDVYLNTLQEVVLNYGPLFEMWWDGANGEGPNGKKQVYDFHRFEKAMHEIAPNTLIFSDIGPHIRWVGNENGFAGATNWNLLDTLGFKRGLGAPPTDTLNQGNENGAQWIPAECDVSIRPGWFYHENENAKVKTPEQLFDLYLKSVGRGANLLLNVPPDTRGQIHPSDSAALMGFRLLVDRNFRKDLGEKAKIRIGGGDKWTKTRKLQDDRTSSFVELSNGVVAELSWKKSVVVNAIEIKEPIALGQKVKRFRLSLFYGDLVVKEIEGTTIGRKRILTFSDVTVDKVILQIQEAKMPALISELRAFYFDKK